ncbi:hypothetical protein [Virgisporangium aurantiacum]|nr:hypothetical protein [Virgisporangium aurantiacum]
MAGHPDDWAVMQGGSAQQQEVSAHCTAHLNRIKAAWYEVKGDPAAITAAITTASSAAHDLKVAAAKVKTTVELRLIDPNWSGTLAVATRRELTTAHRGLAALADLLQASPRADRAPTSLVDRLNVAEPQVRQAPLDVERIATGFVRDADDLIGQAVASEFLRRIQAEFNGIVARWNADTVVGQQEQALGAVVAGFPRVPRLPPRGPEPQSSLETVAKTGALATAVTELREQVKTLNGVAGRYLAGSGLRPFTFGQTASGRRIEQLYEDFRRDMADRIRGFADRIDWQATVAGNLRAGLDDGDAQGASTFRTLKAQRPTSFG